MDILNKKTEWQAKKFFNDILNLWIEFKNWDNVSNWNISSSDIKKIINTLPDKWESLNDILNDFKKTILPFCTNFWSKKFMWFPDSGNSIAGIWGSLLCNFLQQNLINQSFCSPSWTFIEISVIKWLRETVGYSNNNCNNIWDVWWIITWWWTWSNAIWILLARENKFSSSMQNWMYENKKTYIIIPKWIWHYSIKSAQMWAWCWNNLIEVETENYRYNLKSLEDVIKKT